LTAVAVFCGAGVAAGFFGLDEVFSGFLSAPGVCEVLFPRARCASALAGFWVLLPFGCFFGCVWGWGVAPLVGVGCELRVFVENQAQLTLVFACGCRRVVFCLPIRINCWIAVSCGATLGFFAVNLGVLVSFLVEGVSARFAFFEAPFSVFFSARFVPLRLSFFLFPAASFLVARLVILSAWNFLDFGEAACTRVVSERTVFW
jgi:hypothetical protein